MVATEPLPVSQSARPARHLVAVGTELEVLQARPRASRMAAVESLHCGWHACDGESAAAVFLPPVYPDGPARRLDASFQLVLSAAPVECGVLHLPVSSAARVDLRRQPRRRHHRLDERYAQSESWVDFDAAPRLSAARPVRTPRVSRSPRLAPHGCPRAGLRDDCARELSPTPPRCLRHHDRLRACGDNSGRCPPRAGGTLVDRSGAARTYNSGFIGSDN